MYDICMYISCSKYFLNFVFMGKWVQFNYLILCKNYLKKFGKNEIVIFFGYRDKEIWKKIEYFWIKIYCKINF